MSAPRPYTLVAELTYRCPLRCLYCSNPLDFQARRDELTTEQWCQTFSDAAEMGVVQLHLSGGEPTARKDLPALVQHAHAAELYTNLITGGTLLDRDKLERLRDCGLDHIQLSLQDTAERTTDLVVGSRCYHKKLETAKLIGELGFPLTLNYVLHRLNIERVPEMIDQAARLGAQRLELANAQYYAWALENRATLMPSREQYVWAEGIAREARGRHQGRMEIAFVKIDYFSDVPKACSDGWARRYMVILPTGEVLPCHAAHVIPDLRFESVRERPLKAIWHHSAALNAYRGDSWMEEPCKSCEQRTLDFGGCRCQAFLLTGNAAATDPVCRLSPHHDVVVNAALPTDQAAGPLVYRDAHNSRRLSHRP